MKISVEWSGDGEAIEVWINGNYECEYAKGSLSFSEVCSMYSVDPSIGLGVVDMSQKPTSSKPAPVVLPKPGAGTTMIKGGGGNGTRK